VDFFGRNMGQYDINIINIIYIIADIYAVKNKLRA